MVKIHMNNINNVRVIGKHILEISNINLIGNIISHEISNYISHDINYVRFINCQIVGDVIVSNLNLNSDLEFKHCSDTSKESTIVVGDEICLRAIAFSDCILPNTNVEFKGKLEQWPEIPSANSIIKNLIVDDKAEIGNLHLYINKLEKVTIKGNVVDFSLITQGKKCIVQVMPNATIKQASLISEIESAYFQSIPLEIDVNCKAEWMVFGGGGRFSNKNKDPIINIGYRSNIGRLDLGCSGIEVNFKGIQESKLHYVRVVAEDLSKFSFSDCDFSKTQMEFIGIVTSVGIKCSNMKWSNQMTFKYSIDSMTSKPASHEQLAKFYRSIKNSSDESGDVDSRIKFSYLEKNEILKHKCKELLCDSKFVLISLLDFSFPSISKKYIKPQRSYSRVYDGLKSSISNLVDSILLFLSFIISNHCSNLILPIFWLLITPIIVISFSNLFDLQTIKILSDKSTHIFNENFFKYIYPLLLDPTHKIPVDPQNYASNVGSYQSLSSRIMVSIFLYHIVKSFRKYHDK